ncbi:MAG: TIGR03435 family protein [Acidobacteriota bacterium]
MFTKYGLVLMLCSLRVAAQPAPGPRIEFEVAVIKPVDVTLIRSTASLAALGVKVTPQQLSAILPLEQLIEYAYGVRTSQVEGPEWLTRPSSEKDIVLYSIDAKLPEGVLPAQVPLMLRNLLEDRFGLKVRKGSKQMDGYALVVGKNGPGFQKKAAAAPDPKDFSQVEVSLISTGNKRKIGGAVATLGANGSMDVETSTIGGLVSALTEMIGNPIVDKTGLEGSFDIRLAIPASDLAGRLQGGGALDRATIEDMVEQSRNRYFTAVEKIGLKLEKSKNPVDTIVIESVEKSPTEN